MRNQRGQSLVEFVLVFPVAALVGLLIFQGLFIVRTHLLLREVASLGAKTIGTDPRKGPLWPLQALATLRTAPRWGIASTPSTEKEPIMPWPSYTGVSTLDCPGELVSVRVSYVTRGQSFFQWAVPWQTLRARAEFPSEINPQGCGA